MFANKSIVLCDIGKFHFGGNTWLAWLMTSWHGWLPVLPTMPTMVDANMAWLVTPAANHANGSSTMPTTYCHQYGTSRWSPKLGRSLGGQPFFQGQFLLAVILKHQDWAANPISKFFTMSGREAA